MHLKLLTQEKKASIRVRGVLLEGGTCGKGEVTSVVGNIPFRRREKVYDGDSRDAFHK